MNQGASGTTATHATAGRYYTGNSANAWYPAAGYRNGSTGALAGVGATGYYWSASPTGSNGYYLSFTSTTVNPASNYFRAYGFSVRCVAE